MSRACTITKKSSQRGHKVSHANNRRAKTWLANLTWKRVYDSEAKRWVRVKIANRTLRTINKKGLSATLRDLGMKLEDLR